MAGPWEKYRSSAPEHAQGPWSRYRSTPGPDLPPAPEGVVFDPETGQMVDTKAHAQRQSQGILGTLGDIGATALSGVPFVGSYLDETLSGGNPVTLGIARERMNNFEQSNPYSTAGLKMAGAVSAALPAAAAAAPALAGAVPSTLAGKIAFGTAAGGLAGTTEGAVYGYGLGESPAARAQNAGQSALIGGATGAGLGAAAPVASQAVQTLIRKLTDRGVVSGARKALGLDAKTADLLTDAVSADDVFSGAGAQRIADAGPDAMLADAGASTRGLLDASIQSAGPAANQARKAIDDRATRAGLSINRALDNTLGTVQGPKATARGIAQRSAPARQAAYDAAYASPIDYASQQGRNIEDVLARVPAKTLNQAIESANDAMQIGGRANQQIMATIADDGSISFSNPLNVEQLDAIKRALGEQSASAVDTFGRPTGDGIRLSGIARDLRDAVSDAVPGYGEALQLGGDKIAEDRALRLGRDVLKPSLTREDVASAAGNFSAAERAAAQQGARSSIDDMLANVKRTVSDTNMDAREAAKAVTSLSSRANRQKFAELIKNGGGADRLFDQIDRAARSLELRAGVADNSKTHARQRISEALNDRLNEGVLNRAKSGEPLQATKASIQKLFGTAPGDKQRVTQKTWGDIARVLTETRGENAAEALRNLKLIADKSPANKAVADRLMKALLSGTTPGAYQAITSTAGGR